MLYINDNMRIYRGDKYNIILETCVDSVTKSKEVKKIWKFEGYFGTLEEALHAIINQYTNQILDKEETILDILNLIKELKADLSVKVNKALEKETSEERVSIINYKPDSIMRVMKDMEQFNTPNLLTIISNSLFNKPFEELTPLEYSKLLNEYKLTTKKEER